MSEIIKFIITLYCYNYTTQIVINGVPIRGAIGCGLSADIHIRIHLQPGYGYHFFTSVNIHISIQRLGADTDMVKTISDPYPIRYAKVGYLIMISVWKTLFFSGMRQ